MKLECQNCGSEYPDLPEGTTEHQARLALREVLLWYAESPIREIQMAEACCGIKFPIKKIEAALSLSRNGGYEGHSPPLLAIPDRETALVALEFMKAAGESGFVLFEVPDWPRAPNKWWDTKPCVPDPVGGAGQSPPKERETP